MSLREITLSEFTGGLNLRRTQVTLGANESPYMLNMEIDPRGGFFTRRGWGRWNADDVTTPASWAPRSGYYHTMSDGDYIVYVTNGSTIYALTSGGVATNLAISVSASPHLADFAAWGNTVYMACGYNETSYKRVAGGSATAVLDASAGFNDDYTIPVDGRFPQAEFVEAHAGYMFAAYTYEGATAYPNRIRWSHPNQPEDWATLDYIDIETGGGKITALLSFQDHLLIFKDDSVWGLYGYNSESWQLIRISRTAGTPTPTAVTSSESAVYFYSAGVRNGIYAYAGGQAPIDISERLRTGLEEVVSSENVWMGWVGRRLWCSIPWVQGVGPDGDSSTAFVFDPDIGDQGAWVTHRAALGNITCIIDRSDVGGQYPLAAITGDSGAACLVRLDYVERAEDRILEDLTATPFTATYTTGWQIAGSPTVRKSWRRPRFIATQKNESYAVKVFTYKDFNEASPSRSHLLVVDAQGATFWRLTGALEESGFDWGDGSMWGAATAQGSRIVRAAPASEGASGLGVNRALQLQFTTEVGYEGRAWGITAVTLGYILRRMTT